MDKTYELVSGEEINLENLQTHEIKHIESIEEIINSCEQHGRKDYFYVSGEAFKPILVGKGGQSLVSFLKTPFYKVVRDLVERYRQKCSSNMVKEWFDMKSKK